MVKSFGSSADEAEIAQMVERAREFIARQTGTFYNLFNPPSEPDITDFVNNFEGHICICFCAYVLQLEMELLLKAAQSSITVERARELVKTMSALTYTKPIHQAHPYQPNQCNARHGRGASRAISPGRGLGQT